MYLKMNMLIVMRLQDMTRIHPLQDDSHVCSICQSPVGIYPSAQRELKRHPSLKIICNPCAARDQLPDDEIRIAGGIEALGTELEQSHVKVVQ